MGQVLDKLMGVASQSKLGALDKHIELANEDARSELKAFEKAEGFFATPYFLYVDIGGVKFRGGDYDRRRFYRK